MGAVVATGRESDDWASNVPSHSDCWRPDRTSCAMLGACEIRMSVAAEMVSSLIGFIGSGPIWRVEAPAARRMLWLSQRV